MALLAEHFVLREEHAVDAAHEAAALAVEVGVHLLLEGGLVEVAGADGDTQSLGLLVGFACHVLEDGKRAVDTSALAEERADSAAAALGCDEDHVDVGGDLNAGLRLEDRREAVGEVECLEVLA